MAADVQVLIVGAGPTGQALALSLAEMGVSFRVVDALPERSPHSRALLLQARSLELLSAFGVSDGLVALGRQGAEARIYVDRKPAAKVPLADFAIEDSAYPFPLVVSQEVTEAALDAALAQRGVAVERPVELLGFSQDAEGVDATLRHADGREETLRVGWIVGCDGAHSVVRKGAGLSFEGAAYPQDFMLADVYVDWELPGDMISVFLRPGGTLAVFPFQEPGLVRLIATRSGDLPVDQAPTLEEFGEIFREAVPGDFRLRDPVWMSRFRLHHRGVDRYRAGRAFVAGDAAHIHSPAGGQGMNTGIQDALNLGWKLGLVCQGEADAALLDSYDAERAPVGRRLLGWTDRAFSFASSDNALIAAARSLLVPWLAPRLTADPARRARLYRFVSQLGVRYRQSPLSLPWEGEAPEGFAQGPQPGDRGPGGALFDPESGRREALHARLDPGRLHLLVFSGAGPAHAGARIDEEALEAFMGRWPRVAVHRIMGRSLTSQHPEARLDEQGALHARYGFPSGPGVALLRPDGHIVTRAPGLALGWVERCLAALAGSSQDA